MNPLIVLPHAVTETAADVLARETVLSRSKVTQLEKHLFAHLRAVKALALASRELHETVEDVLDTVANAKQTRGRKAKAKRSRRPPSRPPSQSRADSAKARAAALERRWGNLF